MLVEWPADRNTLSCEAMWVVLVVAPADSDTLSCDASWVLRTSEVIELSQAVATARVDVVDLSEAVAPVCMDGDESSLTWGATDDDDRGSSSMAPSVLAHPSPFAPMMLGVSAIELIPHGHASAHDCVIRRLARVVPSKSDRAC